MPQVLDLVLGVGRAQLCRKRAVNLGFDKLVVHAVAPVVQAVAAALPVPKRPADGIDRAAEARDRRALLLQFGEVLRGRCETQWRGLALLPRLDKPRHVERGLSVCVGVVGRQGKRERMVQTDRQPDDLGVAGRHQKAQRRVVQRPHGAFPVILVCVQLFQIAARTLAHAPAAGQPAVRAVGQGHLAAVQTLPNKLALVALAVQRPNGTREPVVVVAGLAQDLRHLRVAGVDVDKAGHVELGVRELALEELPAQRHVAYHRLGLVERVVVVDYRARRDSYASFLGEPLELGQDIRLELGRAIDALQLDVDEPLEVLVALHDLDRPLVDQRRALPVPSL